MRYITLLFLLVSTVGFAQHRGHMGIEMAGPYWSGGLNSEFRIALAPRKKLGLEIGAGISAQGQQGVPLVVTYGGAYYYRDWGVGLRMSSFTSNPVRPDFTQSDISFMLYPNFSYTHYTHNYFARFSVGVILPYSTTYVGARNFDRTLITSDILPGFSATIGRVFRG